MLENTVIFRPVGWFEDTLQLAEYEIQAELTVLFPVAIDSLSKQHSSPTKTQINMAFFIPF